MIEVKEKSLRIIDSKIDEYSVSNFSSFRCMIFNHLGVDSLNYLDNSNILLIQKIADLVEAFDSVIPEGEENISLSKKDSSLLRSTIDDLDSLRIDIYNSRLL